MQSVVAENFDQWRDAARRLLIAGVPPHHIAWSSDRAQPTLFGGPAAESAVPEPDAPEARSSVTAAPNGSGGSFVVPRRFLEVSRQVGCHRDTGRWQLLYRILWRLKHGEPQLLEVITDDDVDRLSRMAKSVSRDVHKMKAFVRFRRVMIDGEETFVAWHRPDHRIVPLVAPFFARRFRGMTWSILTPDESVSWNQQALHYGPGAAVNPTGGDALEDLWRTYYAAIFNPARVKVAAMKREMPVRHWPTLPETELIAPLLRQAEPRVNQMLKSKTGSETTAAEFLPDRIDLSALAQAASRCTACDLHRDATQSVFGEGPPTARLVLLGEQPGDREDLEGHPFVGPAGVLLDEALAEAEVAREEVYITNVVKHFKFTMRGKRRLHQKPNAREIRACRPWLEAELQVLQPHSLVCLGATAAQALLGRDFRITQRRGEITASSWSQRTIATWHPAAILRMPDEARRQEMKSQLIEDLRLAKE